MLFFFNCSKNDHIRTYRLPKSTVQDPINAQISENIPFAKIKWDKPQSWIETDGHSMRLASFQVPYTNGFGDLSITTFEGKSGGITANVNRWLGQIGLEALSSEEIQNITATKIGSMKQFSFFKLINPANKQKAILASIYEVNNRSIFIKLMSEVICLTENENDFIKFCKSITLSDS